MTATAASSQALPRPDAGIRSESITRCDSGAEGLRTRLTPGSAAAATSTRSRSRPRGNASAFSGGKPPCSGMRIMTPRASLSASDFRLGKVTLKISGNSSRPRKVIAPARSQASQPPPSHAAHFRLRGSSNSTTSPDSSHAPGTRMRCVTSGPRGTFNVRVVTLARTSGTTQNLSLNRASGHRLLGAMRSSATTGYLRATKPVHHAVPAHEVNLLGDVVRDPVLKLAAQSR